MFLVFYLTPTVDATLSPVSGLGGGIFGGSAALKDARGTNILTYIYDPNGKVTNRWSIGKGTTSYSYDPMGNLTYIQNPASASVSFSYDALNPLTTMVDGLGTSSYGYTAALRGSVLEM